MKRFANATRTRLWIGMMAAALGVIGLCEPAAATQGILDYDKFMKDIEPLLTTQTYDFPTPGTTCISCHGDPNNVASSTFSLVLGDSRQNFERTAVEVSIEAPDLSAILQKPSPKGFKLYDHGAGDSAGAQFTGPADPHYLKILNWILDARNATVGARITRTEPHPNPFRYYVDIVYFLTTNGDNAEVSIYANNGKHIITIPGTSNVGANLVRWDGRSPDLEPQPTGVYFYTVKVKFDDGTSTVKGRCVYTP